MTNVDIKLDDVIFDEADIITNEESIIETCVQLAIYKQRIEKAIEILKLCNSKCAKETICILRGEDNE